MHLTHRPVEPADYPRCLDISERGFYARSERPRVERLWNHLAARGGLILSAVEDQARDGEERIVGVGASVFVHDRFIEEAMTSRGPHLAQQLVREELAGDGPVLDASAVRRANSHRGVNIFSLDLSIDRDRLTPDEALAVRNELIAAFHDEHCGYKINEILSERYGEEAVRRALSAGFNPRRDYREYYEANGPAPPADRHPYLVGISRGEARQAEGSKVASLFLYSPPRFRFRPGDQALLARALLGETDEELSLGLSVSASAIKKRWAAIFEHAALIAPELVGQDEPKPAGAERKRGAEKRRRLLAYLRHHPEDLRPFAPEVGMSSAHAPSEREPSGTQSA